MRTLHILSTFVQELVGARSLPREPEPDLVMDGPDQVQAYAQAGRIDGVMAASYLFHSARISMTIRGSARVVDLGCGPGTQLAQIAQLNPKVQFTGVDMSPAMLADARAYTAQLGLSNVDFQQGDITQLAGVPDAEADAVISTMALHHLPTQTHLEACFAQISRVLRPGGAVYLTDFGRLKSLKSVIYFAYMNRQHQPHLFSLDYERSLRAAFTREDFARAAQFALPADVSLNSTFKVPFLVMLKTPDRGLDDATLARVKQLTRALQPRYKRDLNDMRLFFRLGGLRDDPFAV